jgi:hypothetical protein
MNEMREKLDTNTPYVNFPVPERVRRLAAQIKEKYDSEEFQAFWQPVIAALSHEKKTLLHAGVYTWAEERIGCKPDFVLGVYLRNKELGDATPRETWALVDDRGEKLRGEDKGQADDLAIAVFDEKIKEHEGLRRVRSELSNRDDWILEIAKAIWIAGAESPYGYPVKLSAVEHRILRDNRWQGMKGTPEAPIPASTVGPEEGMIELEDKSPGGSHESVEEELFLAYYASAENLAAELTPTEREVFRLAIHLEHREIAEEIGSTEGSVRKLKHQAVEKIRKHAEITVRHQRALARQSKKICIKISSVW